MALSGLVLVLFVISHMLGNLKMFAGMDALTGRYKMDVYAEMLRAIGAGFLGHETFLWIARCSLLGCLLLHVVSAAQLARLNAQAKPVALRCQRYGSSNAASRSMIYGGLFLLCFVVFHILHFTTGTLHGRGFEEGAVFSNVYLGFQNGMAAGFYVIAMGFLCLHLYHGAWSMFQTLGVDSPQWNFGIRALAKGIAIILFIGFSSVPIAVKSGFIKMPSGPPVALASDSLATSLESGKR